MSKSEAPSRLSFRHDTPMHRRPDYSLAWGILIGLGVIAYNLSWLTSTGAGLTFGAYDLAEWVSLHPAVRAAPLMAESAVLRLPIALLALVAAFRAQHMFSWSGLFVVTTAVTLLPPLDFLTQTNDLNYRQQLLIAFMTLLGGGFGLSGLLSKWRQVFGAVAALLGAIISLSGWSAAHQLLLQFEVPALLGTGAPLMIAVFLIAAGWFFWDQTNHLSTGRS